MIRALWFIAKLAVVIAIAIWLAERPGTVVVDWQGWHFETSFGMMVLAAVIALGVAAFGYRIWRAVWLAPSRLRRSSKRRKRERGYKALTRGMVAVAAGDATAARHYARQADVLLNEPPLTMLLSAQAAQLTGDEGAAQRYFKAMLDRPETAFLGTRGLLTQALKSGDQVEALDLARRANQLQPRTPWVLAVLFDLESRSGKWAAAESTLRQALDAGAVPAEEGKPRRAALLVERSLQAEGEGRHDAALSHAQTAFDLRPDFAPAAARFAHLLVKAGKFKKAARTIERAWKLDPHPLLAAAYGEVLADYDPQTRLKLVRRLESIRPDHVENDIALARAAMGASLWEEARGHLEKALAKDSSTRVLRLFAELEKAEHGDGAAARDWLAKAANAGPGPAWTCHECGGIHGEWRGLCSHCGSFGTLEWAVPTTVKHLSQQPLEITTLPPGALPPTRAPMVAEAAK